MAGAMGGNSKDAVAKNISATLSTLSKKTQAYAEYL